VLTDTHCHLDSEAFDADRPAVIGRAREAGIERILVPALDVHSSRRCVELCAEYPGLFAAVGIHPTEVEKQEADGISILRGLAVNPKVVAIGEIGLDYYWVQDAEQQSHQRDVLLQQLELAAKLGKPVVIHAREKGDADQGPCADDLMAILEDWVKARANGESSKPVPGVLHSFSSNLDVARRAIELGFYIGVTGPVTYKNAERRRDVIAALPLERLLIETDAPYLAPQPHRGSRNEPAYVTYIADKIAAIQSSSPEEVAAVTGQNAAQIFSWRDAA
jgi:TatD DNase family protein